MCCCCLYSICSNSNSMVLIIHVILFMSRLQLEEFTLDLALFVERFFDRFVGIAVGDVEPEIAAYMLACLQSLQRSVGYSNTTQHITTPQITTEHISTYHIALQCIAQYSEVSRN